MKANKKNQPAALAAICLLLSLQSNAAVAQVAAPLENPSEAQIIEALTPSGARTKAFRPTAAPDTVTHACPEVSAGTSTGGSGTKDLAPSGPTAAPPVPFAGDGAPTINLAINFATGSDKVAQGSRNALDTLARVLMSPSMRTANFAVAGHTDAQGDFNGNLRLSCARAIAVRSYLIQSGVQPIRLGAYGFGPKRPLDTANTVSSINRRVEIHRAD